jgi:cytochrome c biogenesis protein CcmG/thiol:disulfide interchange protein DsbE
MNRRNITLAAALIVSVSVAAAVFLRVSATRGRSGPANAVKTGFQPGEYAPDFELRSLDGLSVRLSSLRGKPVLLNFWATWCAPCKIEMPWLVELDQQYRAKGIQIVGVSLDDAGDEKDVATFAKDRGVNYTVLLGNSAVANTYGGVRLMPQNFFIDADGKITKTAIGLTDKKDLEEGLASLLKPIAESEVPGPNFKIGDAIPQLGGVDQFGKRQDFNSLKGADGLVLLFFRSADW